jgi:hypothetical protein
MRSSQYRYRHRIVGLFDLAIRQLTQEKSYSEVFGRQFDGSGISGQQVKPPHTKRQPFADTMIQINQVAF